MISISFKSFFRSRSRKGRERKKKKSEIRNRMERLLFQRYMYARYTYVYIYRYDPASMTGHCIRGIHAERLLHASEYAFTRRQTPMFGFSSTALAEIHRIHAIRPIFAARESMLISYMRFVDGKLKGGYWLVIGPSPPISVIPLDYNGARRYWISNWRCGCVDVPKCICISLPPSPLPLSLRVVVL